MVELRWKVERGRWWGRTWERQGLDPGGSTLTADNVQCIIISRLRNGGGQNGRIEGPGKPQHLYTARSLRRVQTAGRPLEHRQRQHRHPLALPEGLLRQDPL